MKETEVRSLTQLVIVISVFNNKIRNVHRKSGNEARIYKVIETSLRRPHCSSVCRLKFTLECFMTPNQRKKCFVQVSREFFKSLVDSHDPGPEGLVCVAGVRFYEMI